MPRTRQRRASRLHERHGQLRLVGYVRVSTDEQAHRGVSLDAQRERLFAYAKAHGYELLVVESDNGASGKIHPRKRQGLALALGAVERQEADGIVFLKLDRLSRSVRDVLDLADEAQKCGWHLVSVQENIDTSTAAGRMILTVLAALSQMEREQVSERTKAALDQVARESRPRSSRLPFGYQIDGEPTRTRLKAGGDSRRLVEHPKEQRILRAMLELRGQGKGAQRIAQALNGMATPNPRTGRPWNYGTIAAILRTVDRRTRALALDKGET